MEFFEENMREIEFRGKRQDNGEWVFGGYNRRDVDDVVIIAMSPRRNIGDMNYEVIPETVGQFSGLLDKNETKAFKGDKIKTVHYGTEYTGTIVFESGAFLFRTQDENNEVFDVPFWEIDEFEVVGNIYESREEN